jgi:hypothetical protein
MPITYTVDHRAMRVNAVATGVVSADEIARYVQDRVRDGIHDYDQLADLSAVMFAATVDGVVQTVESTRRELGAGPVAATAIVAPVGLGAESAVRAIADAFTSTGAKVRVFGTQKAATQWLDQLSSGRRGGNPHPPGSAPARSHRL